MSRSNNMILYIKNISGNSLRFELQPGSSVLDLKKKVEYAERYHLDSIGLDFGAQSLENDRMIADYNLQNESTLILVRYFEKILY